MFQSIGILSLSTARQAGNIEIYRKTSAYSWLYEIKQRRWEKKVKPIFTARELSILRFSIQGFSIQETANLLCLSSDTIKFHRKKIIAKCQVHTLTEAIRYAIGHKLL
ncbi:response regulator transcription factor [Myroides sp. C15-4]|uniref:response regulator transcription factor n=1 Tax=Myroides sp. C15-4 TaxID=3400532 RepID=UPI003D2F61E8